MNITDLTINGVSFADLLPTEQACFQFAAPFDQTERDWFAGHWLTTDQDGVDEINGVLENANVEARVWPSPRSEGSVKRICADVLTETFTGGSHAAAASQIRALPIDEWVEPPEPED